MSMPSSNMSSKNYCPNCGGFDLVKLHRSFIQKRILDAPNKLYCQSCDLVLSVSDFGNNPAKEIPVFIGGSTVDGANVKDTDSYSSETDHGHEQTSSVTVDEITASEASRINMPIKKKNLSAWWLYFSGALVIGVLSYFGYKYMNDYPELSAKSPNFSIDSTLSSKSREKVHVNELIVVPQLQADVAVESEKVLKSVGVVSSGLDMLVSVPATVPARQAAEVVVATPKLTTEVVEKLQVPVVVPKVETEVRIVLPFKGSEHLAEGVGQSGFGGITRDDLKNTNELLEKATVEFLRRDLDKLLTN